MHISILKLIGAIIVYIRIVRRSWIIKGLDFYVIHHLKNWRLMEGRSILSHSQNIFFVGVLLKIADCDVWGGGGGILYLSEYDNCVIQCVVLTVLIYLSRWSELTRKIELWVEIQELNEQGEYSPVEVITKPDIVTGGIYQLRQGQQRRIQVRVKPVQNSGTLPIICQSIVSVAIGSVSVR
jgi:hypothetical protein